jgi:KDO2-lipid IV(A) lauroyltransferase
LRFADSCEILALKALGYLPESSVPLCGKLLGSFAYYLHEKSRHKREVHRAVSRALGANEHETERIVRRNFEHTVRMLLEIMRLPRLGKKLRDLVEIAGAEHLAAAAQQGKGVILVTAHIGNFEYLVSGLPLLGSPSYCIAWKQPGNVVNQYLDSIRMSLGTRLLYSQEMSTKVAVDVLNQGGTILIGGDHYNLGRNVIKFFGFDTPVPAGPIHYSLITGAPIVPIYILRQGTHHRITVEPPMWLPAEFRSKDELYADGLDQLVSVFERWIRSSPEQYMWILRRGDWGREE